MSRPIKVILAVVAVAALAWLGWAPVQAGYLDKIKERRQQARADDGPADGEGRAVA